MFTPRLLKQQQYYLSGKTAADAFEAERQLLKIDERLSRTQLGPAVANAMSRLEAVSTVRIDGLSPSSRDLLIIDSLFRTKNLRYFGYTAGGSSFCTRSASMEAFYYLETLRWIKKVVKPGFKFTPQFIWVRSAEHPRLPARIPHIHRGIRVRADGEELRCVQRRA